MMIAGTLDDALQRALELRAELAAINKPGLDPRQLSPLADAEDMTATVINRIETAIAIDDELHPEDLVDPRIRAIRDELAPFAGRTVENIPTGDLVRLARLHGHIKRAQRDGLDVEEELKTLRNILLAPGGHTND